MTEENRHQWDWAAEHAALLQEPSFMQAGEMLLSLAGAFVQLQTSPQAQAAKRPVPAPQAPERRVSEMALVSVDTKGKIVGYGEVSQRVFGYSASEVLGKELRQLLRAPEGEPYSLSDGHLYFAPGVEGRRRSGEHFPVLLGVDALAVGETSVLVVSCQDITQQLKDEEATRKAQARYQLLVEQIPAVTFLCALDEGANDIYIGPQIEQLLGFTQEEWLSNPVLWYEQLHPDDRGTWNKEFARGCQTGGPFRSECRLFARDGTVKWVHGEARVVRDEEGKPLFLQGIMFDISERKEAERQTHEAQDAIGRNERLAALGQLAGAVAHDLRNPLGAIRNAWFYVRKKAKVDDAVVGNPRLGQMADLINGELDRCAKIIGELLDFARAREPYRVATGIRELVESSLQVVARPSEDIQILRDIPDDLPISYVDTGQFRQVVVNLIQNAVEAVDPSEGVVTIRGRSEGEWLWIEVEDNGVGIPSDMLKKIMEPLVTTKQKGTGLGLSVVAGILERHKGEVLLESEEGKGTCFKLRFPVGTASVGVAPSVGGASDLRD